MPQVIKLLRNFIERLPAMRDARRGGRAASPLRKKNSYTIKLALVRGNNGIIKPDHISFGLFHQILLIPKIDGPDPGKHGAPLGMGA